MMIIHLFQPGTDIKIESEFGGSSVIEAAVGAAEGAETSGEEATIIIIH